MNASEWLGRFPAAWKVKRLKYLTEITSSGVWGEDPLPQDPMHPVVTTANIDTYGHINPEGIALRALSKRDLEQGLCRPGDIIVVKSSGSATNVISGKAGLVQKQDGAICFNNFTLRLRPDAEKLNPRFAWYFLNSEIVRSQIRLMVSTTTYPNLQVEEYLLFLIPNPTLQEQLAIADFLDRETARLDALVAAKERWLGLLAEKRRALISQAVARGINPGVPLRESGLPWLGQIPAHWPLLRAKYLWREIALPVGEGDEMVTCFRDGQVTLRKNRREEGFTNAVKELGYQGIRAGHLVLHSMDAFAGAIGVSDSDGKCTPEYIICEAIREGVLNSYYGFLLREMALTGFIQATCPSVRERAPRIHFSDFGDMFFPVPPLAEQRAIVAYISAAKAKLDGLRAATERTISLLRERRAALIAAAVTGKIEIPGK